MSFPKTKFMFNFLPILIGSQNDKVFLQAGEEYLKSNDIDYKIIVCSTHREPLKTSQTILKLLKNKKLKVIIAGAATATGLPGVLAGYLKETNIIPIGVRFTKTPQANILEDASFNLSSMPQNVPLLYAGFNEKGFLHACMLVVRILNQGE